MKSLAGLAFCAISSLCLIHHPAIASSTRTYVSGNGKDGTSCSSPASPCKTLQAAVNSTSAGGEIFVLDSSNYGPVTITQSLSITSEGASAGILAPSGAAVTIAAGATDIVNLKGIDLDGGNTASIGIQFSSGAALNIHKSTMRGFTASGLSFTSTGPSALFVSETVVSGNGKNGILISGSTGTTGVLSRVSASKNGVGLLVNGSGVRVTVTGAVANNNTYGIGAAGSAVTVSNSTFSNNNVGIAADQSAIVQVTQSTITANSIGWTAANSAQVLSFGNNSVAANTSNGTPSSSLALQ